METPATAKIQAPPDRFCEHGTPAGSECGRCAALGAMTEPQWLTCLSCGSQIRQDEARANGRCTCCTTETLFPTAAELGVPPVAFLDGDVSRIEVTVPASIEEYERLHAQLEAKRTAKRKRVEGSVAGLGTL
jgi:hypothetical protein